ncbi:MAG: hypothetical protein RJA81_865 [Planctomycetota bacterium]
MFRSAIHVVAGLLAGCLVVGLIETVSHAIWPPPDFFSNPSLNADADEIAKRIAQVPLPAKISVVLAWALGSMTGGFVSARLAGVTRPARSVAIVMLVFILLNLMTVPHPLWMSITGVALPLPAARLGARLSIRRNA